MPSSVSHTFLIFIIIAFHLKDGYSAISNQNDTLKSVNESQIISEILKNNFVLAEELLSKTPNNTDPIPSIVRQTYAGSDKNLNQILKFAKGLSTIATSFKVLKSLRDEMKSYGHYNPLMLMQLTETIESEVLRQTKGNSSKPGAKIIVDEIVHDIDVNSFKILKAAMLAQNFRNNVNLLNNLHVFRPSLSDSIMQRLVNETFGRIPSIQMADNIYEGSSKIPQIITGLLTLYDKLESTNNTNDDAVIRIARNIKLLKGMKNYHYLPKKKKIAVNRLVEKLPACAKNLIFASRLCIWNRGKLEYLYASDAQFYFTRRSVFTCSIDDINNDGIWNVEEINDRYYFRSQAHAREYLYASTTDRHGAKENRIVETWMDAGFLGDTSAWSIELDGIFCYIRNENFNEYIFASDEKHGEKRRYVFTSMPKRKDLIDNRNFQWQIRNCG